MKPANNWTAQVTTFSELIIAISALVEAIKAVITQ
jgi:hypothetical protein